MNQKTEDFFFSSGIDIRLDLVRALDSKYWTWGEKKKIKRKRMMFQSPTNTDEGKDCYSSITHSPPPRSYPINNTAVIRY